MTLDASPICNIRASTPPNDIQSIIAIIYYHCIMRAVSLMVESGVHDSLVIKWHMWPHSSNRRTMHISQHQCPCDANDVNYTHIGRIDEMSRCINIGWRMRFDASSIWHIHAPTHLQVIQPTNAIIYYHCIIRSVSLMVESGVHDHSSSSGTYGSVHPVGEPCTYLNTSVHVVQIM